MCIIIDNCVRDDFFGSAPSAASIAVREWITDRGGCVVYGGKLAEELLTSTVARRTLAEWSRTGRARVITKLHVDAEQARLCQSNSCLSNDSHVVALARISGARVLYSKDANLHTDFKTPALINDPRGKVYTSADHKSLLGHVSSCQRLGRGVPSATRAND